MGDILGGIPIVGDLLAGKKDPGVQAQQINMMSPQAQEYSNQALGKFGDLLNQDPSQIAANQTSMQEAAARQNVKDQEIRAKQMVAQRGLGNSSVGLNAILGQQGELGNQIGAIRANKPILENQLRNQNLQTASQGISSIIGSQGQNQVYQPAQASKGRQGGLMPILGGVAGAILSPPGLGAQGAQVGMGMGQMLTQV